MRADLQNKIILILAPHIGPVTWNKLVQHFGSATEVLRASRKAHMEVGLKPDTCDYLSHPNLTNVEISIKWSQQEGHHILELGNDDYPKLLSTISSPPPLLFVTGNPALLSHPQIAIVGTRNPSPDGKRTAFEFARDLAASGFTITSGLAIGIDKAAHEGAMAGGTTIAVGGTGPDLVYPAAHRNLAHQIVATGGALVTELIPGTKVRKENFPQRNRIISGLALGTLIVEAALKSGALITATTAVDQGREVFAIPGSVHNPTSKGCHNLIRNGAKLVDTTQDIVEELASLIGSLQYPAELPKPVLKTTLPALPPVLPKATPVAPVPQIEKIVEPQVIEDLDAEHRALLDCIGYDPIAQEVLIQRSGLTASLVAQMLFMLELEGYISPVPGGRFIRNRR
ncbi:hypothetical protein TI04_08735 [Achromatium sp. WMS2]|nr:hypothetical protein TI04_08735 [Achromatium sp. WMS2]